MVLHTSTNETKPPSPRTTVRRLPQRARYDRETVEAILDEGLVAHLGLAVDGQPYVLPTTYGRDGSTVYVHGSAASRLLRTLGEGVPMCLSVTLLDGLVLARSAFHHSMNYRSVVLLGRGRPVEEPREKLHALEVILDHVVPGRSGEARAPNERELKATAVLAIPIDEASAKIRTGPPVDDEEDYRLRCWAGVLPLGIAAGAPVPDPRLLEGLVPPGSLRADRRWTGPAPAGSAEAVAGEAGRGSPSQM
jgi:nitroimidazol reductase NimA-like FMN-containing flavoprotein (pyridoxamine 5'-phosphate oxidase superfamily)